MAKAWKPPDCQLRFVEGLPGAGKSFMLVRKTLKVIEGERRPVYTNLPIRFRVMRTYLRNRGGEPMANLIVELTETHWKEFLKRNESKQRFREEYKTECKNNAKPYRETTFERVWIETHGPDVTRPGTGQQPNWIDPYSVIIIDEVQHWHTVDANVKRTEGPELRAYLTMMRHHLHDVYIASQSSANVPKTIRDLVRQFWKVEALQERKIAWGIRFKHLGLRAIGYRAYSAEQMETMKRDRSGGEFGSQPLEGEVVFPTLPHYQYIFRLYRSFTHVESPRRMMEQLRKIHDEAGLTHMQEQLDSYEKKEQTTMIRKAMGFTFKAAILGAMLTAGVMIGTAVTQNNETETGAEVVADAPGQLDITQPVQWWPEEGKLSAVNMKGVVTNEGSVEIGRRFGLGLLRSVDVHGRRAMFTDADSIWVWNLGSARPQRVASRDDLRKLESRIAGAHAAAESGAEPDTTTEGSSTVGPPTDNAGGS